MTMQELYENLQNVLDQAHDDYTQMAAEELDNTNDQKAAYYRGIRKGWHEAFEALESILTDEGGNISRNGATQAPSAGDGRPVLTMADQSK